jgi:hypothetical protein
MESLRQFVTWHGFHVTDLCEHASELFSASASRSFGEIIFGYKCRHLLGHRKRDELVDGGILLLSQLPHLVMEGFR